MRDWFVVTSLTILAAAALMYFYTNTDKHQDRISDKKYCERSEGVYFWDEGVCVKKEAILTQEELKDE